MKTRPFSWILALMTCFLLSSTTKAAQTVVFTSDPWPPFILGVEGKEATGGVGYDLIKEIFDRIDGADFSIPLVPWKRALKNVETGKMDAITFLYKTDEREKVMEFSAPLFKAEDLFWYSQEFYPDGLNWSAIDDLKEYTIGYVSGYSYSEEIDAALANGTLKAIKVNSPKKLFTMLEKGRINVALANKVVGNELSKQPGRKITYMKKPVTEEDYYMSFSKKTNAKDLIPKINQAVNELRSEGKIEQIIYGN